MRSLGIGGWFPLLTKELTELANRRRTYVVRFLFGAFLFGGGLMILYGRTGGAVSSTARLGQGAEIFEQIVRLQFACVFLFLPAMTAGALTVEKERDTLTLLLLTTMRPTAILLQKVLSRVIPMLCFVVLSFPLMAAAYSFGGVTTESVYAAMWVLTLFVLYVASVAVMCSSFFRTTVEAFIATYALLAISVFCCPVTFIDAAIRVQSSTAAPGWLAATTVISLVVIVACLTWARIFLVHRAFIPPRNVMLDLFHALDRMFNEWNQVTGGVVLVKDGDPLPGDRPVAWRETAKKSLGTFRYLFRVMVALEVPILFVAQLVNINSVRNDSVVSALLQILWVIAVAMVCVHAASVVSSERSRQTLDVLLTAPLTGRELLLQKMAGLRRLHAVLLVPFTTIFLFHHWFRDYRSEVLYLLLSLATVFVFIPLTAWMSLWIGLKLRSHIRAVFLTLAVVSLIVMLPVLIDYLFTRVWGVRLPEIAQILLDVSPVRIVQRLEDWHTLKRGPDEVDLLVSTLEIAGALAVFAAAAWALRAHCLGNADRFLGRVAEGEVFDSNPPTAAAVSPQHASA